LRLQDSVAIIFNMKRKAIKKNIYQYTAVFEEDPKGGYTVTIPALPGRISEGNTFEDTIHNIHEAAELYLEVMRKRKAPIATQDSKIIIAPVEVYA